MKQKVINFSALLSMLAFIWSCDNGYTDFPIVDTAPKITLSSVLSGLTEGEDFKIDVTLSDGVDNGTISTLDNFSYAVTKGGATVKSGSQELSGESQTINLVIAGGFEPGQYNLDIKATDSNGNEGTENLSFTVASAKPAFDISGVWSMEPIAGAMKVGPAPGSSEWYQNSAGDVAARACFFDDKYTFNADGTFKIDMGSQTWLEQWQGVAADGCGAPKAPFDGVGSFTYTYTTTTLTLIGRGAHVGLAKVNNAGEISNGAAVANQIAYTIVEQTKTGNTRRMTLRIQAGNGVWWDFKLISGAAPAPASIVGKWKMEPVEAALAVGPTAGSREWYFNSTADVTTRACFFDDVYTFGADGSFSLDMGGSTWLETWQGAAEGCGTPKAPHDGVGSFTYQFTGTSLKLVGKGAHVALPKAVNAGELPNTAVPNDVTYQVVSLTEDGGKKKMTLQIEAGTGVWWTFKLISE
ncbi:hypothetical protein DFQ04_3372 [Algoriphagus boseongensis]|uniref:Uncharacterized protein n=1 Tax=Algoriphagus boseongensis TaxID=1442587 RepID=A0A4R6T3K6_9BACT|nr:hypothetical protein [Algoriphagus boseongensis]TDQ14778.1 hypothetical protein DFQ04_3372 [Algoriphagus boseongensis]